MGAKVNTLRTRILLQEADLVVAFFGADFTRPDAAVSEDRAGTCYLRMRDADDTELRPR